MILIITQDSKASRLKSGFFAMVYKNTWRYVVELESSHRFGNQKQQGQQLVVYREFASSLEVKAETNKVVQGTNWFKSTQKEEEGHEDQIQTKKEKRKGYTFLSDKCGMIAKLQGLDTKDDEAVATARCKKFVDLVVIYHETAYVPWVEKSFEVGEASKEGLAMDLQGQKDMRVKDGALETSQNRFWCQS